MPGPKCTICILPQRAAIDKDCLDLAFSTRKIADKYGLKLYTLQRHRTRHVPKLLARAAARADSRAEAQVGDGLLQYAIARRDHRLSVLNRVHERLAARIESGQMDEVELKDVLRELRHVSELAAREMGQLQPTDATRHGNQPVVVIVTPPAVSGPAARVLTLDVPGRMAPPETIDVPLLEAGQPADEPDSVR